MATIEERLQNVRTMEDVVYLLSVLFTNLNNQNKMYYDMFLNPTPMDIDLERYDENGKLVTVTLPNRAKDRIWVLTGKGNPNGQIAAKIGTIYLDETSKNLWFKSDGADSDTSGWKQIYDSSDEFLRPDGNGSRLTDLNANSITDGILNVIYGGTGTGYITDGYLVQGHGTDRFTPFNLDDLSTLLNEFVGMIMWCPMNEVSGRWLICDGKAYPRDGEYSALFAKIGTKYGIGDGSTTFNVPNLIGRYIKGSSEASSDLVEGSVKSHSHALSGNTEYESSHTHGPGSLNATGKVSGGDEEGMWDKGSASGVFSIEKKSKKLVSHSGSSGNNTVSLSFSLLNKMTGSTGYGSSHRHALSGTTQSTGSDTNEVDHSDMIPVIRY
jgi:microcystin-dependent protein